MAELQAIGAAIGIAVNIGDLGFKTARLIRKVIEARTEATRLRHRVNHLRLLADRVVELLRARQRQDGLTEDRNVLNTIRVISESLDECRICLKLIEEKLDPLDVGPTDARPPDFIKRIKLVCSERFIKDQQNLIDTHLAGLSLDLGILQSLDQTATKKAVQDLTSALVKRAIIQREDLSDLSPPDTSDDPPSPRLDPPSVEDLAAQSKHCPACQRLNTHIPETFLELAVNHRQADRIKPLIEEGYDANVRDDNGWTLLHRAADMLDRPTTCALLDAISATDFVNALTNDERTALMLVAEQADFDVSCDIAEELIRRGGRVGIQDSTPEQRTALWFAVKDPHSPSRERMVDLLVDKGATVSSVRNGTLRDEAKTYPKIEEAAKREEEAQEKSMVSRNNTPKDGIGHRLSQVFSNK